MRYIKEVPTLLQLFPYRALFGFSEIKEVLSVFLRSRLIERDFGFQDYFENRLSLAFAKEHNSIHPLFVDCLSSGTAAVYVACKACGITQDDKVIVSPITNPGSIMPVLMTGCSIIVPDSNANDLNISVESFREAVLVNKPKAAVITHLGGISADISNIASICSEHNVLLIEDCSQSYFALSPENKFVGTYGDLSVYSAMYSKTFAMGGCGGLLMTKHKHLYEVALSFADRGKPFGPHFNVRNTDSYLFPSFNFNADELSCAIGFSILKKIPSIIRRRRKFAQYLSSSINQHCQLFNSRILPKSYCSSSPFFLSIHLDHTKVSSDLASHIKQTLNDEQLIPVNAQYKDFVHLWKWLPADRTYFLPQSNSQFHAAFVVNILFNERFKLCHAKAILQTLLDYEKQFLPL